MWAFVDHGPAGTGEPLAALLRPGNAGSNTASDHLTVIRAALRQLPGHRAGHRLGRKVLVRVDGAGATHELLDWLHTQRLSYSVGFGLTQQVVDLLAALPAGDARSRTAPEAWPAVLLRLLRATLPGEVWNNPAVWPQWQPLLVHVLTAIEPDRSVEGAADELSWLIDRTASYKKTRGNPRAVLRLFQRGYALRRDRLGEDHPSSLTSASNLAVNLRGLGEYQQARTLDEDTLARRRRILGEDHPDTRQSERNLAAVLRKLDQTTP